MHPLTFDSIYDQGLVAHGVIRGLDKMVIDFILFVRKLAGVQTPDIGSMDEVL